MRRLKSEKELEAKRKKMQLLVGLFMVGLMVFATAGWFASEMFGGNQDIQGSSVEYGGRTYFRQSDFWILQEQGRNFYFHDLPTESRGIYKNQSNFFDYSGKILYIVNFVSEAQFILLNLDGVYSRWQEACFDGLDCEANLPTKDCSDNMIIFKEGNTTSVERQDNCVFIEGDFRKGVDAFSYSLLQIR